MIGGLAANFLAGSGMKVLSYLVTKFFDRNEKFALAGSSASTEKIQALQSGEDNADGFTKHTRRWIAFKLTLTYCFIMIWIIVNHPQGNFDMQVPKTTGFLSMFWGSVDVTTIQVSTITIVQTFAELYALVGGFYFTKVGK